MSYSTVPKRSTTAVDLAVEDVPRTDQHHHDVGLELPGGRGSTGPRQSHTGGRSADLPALDHRARRQQPAAERAAVPQSEAVGVGPTWSNPRPSVPATESPSEEHLRRGGGRGLRTGGGGRGTRRVRRRRDRPPASRGWRATGRAGSGRRSTRSRRWCSANTATTREIAATGTSDSRLRAGGGASGGSAARSGSRTPPRTRRSRRGGATASSVPCEAGAGAGQP